MAVAYITTLPSLLSTGWFQEQFQAQLTSRSVAVSQANLDIKLL